ncbi:uncharacterized protein CANTADRAFT_22336 [Suhomyces tanzawaensis NRRL Y-17324]|uniref:DUF1741-domain-containing protein n=1 Tax=Suhomyces tanzawaensis NRRL Y-17324 TaxID=984487 RepID=A0A1E4SFN2_9ASCO|nr:uncharacterized protein CANTADRAFT_22336 [Suhomyces tanzawaensis NRRL Y-17324]ODV78323.1 hypothetical protein CANTADRAFT_22336 [Suhomyces tanzawaensis NRRL Y-17324]
MTHYATIHTTLANAAIQLLRARDSPDSIDPQTLELLYASVYRVLDTIPLKHRFKVELDLISPLTSVLDFYSTSGTTFASSRLKHLLIATVWLSLTNANVLRHTVPVFPALLALGKVCQSLVGVISEEPDMLYVTYTLHADHHRVGAEIGETLLSRFSNTALKIEELFVQLDTYKSTHSSSLLFESLSGILLLLINEDLEICTLMLVQHPRFPELTRMHEDEMTSANQKLLLKILDVVARILIPKYSLVFEFFSSTIPSSNVLFIKDYSPENPDLLKSCVLCILELLDHGTTIQYLKSRNLVTSLFLALRTLRVLSRLALHTEYNRRSSKVSFGAGLIYLNYLICINLMNQEEIKGMANLSTPFKKFSLAPLPKSAEFVQDSSTEDSFGLDVTHLESKLRRQNLWICLLLNLEILLDIIEDELRMSQYICGKASQSLQKKLLFQRIDMVLATLITTLILAKDNKKNSYLAQVVSNTTIGVINQILNLSLEKLEKSLVWVCLINFANDLCYSDLKHLQMFHDLFESLIKKDESVLNDSLIRSGLEFFQTTFDHSAEIVETKLVPLRLQDFNFLYETKNKSKDAEDSSPKEDTNLRNTYVTNSARKQSVHIDQFGR